MSACGANDNPAIDVPAWLHLLGGLVDRHPGFCKRLGRLESSSLYPDLDRVQVVMPIFICGLARSGTTLLHEVVAAHPSVATHQMRDYPLVFTPYWWRRATAKRRPEVPRERAHRDGMMVTTESPDALEEMVWMAFFSRRHDPMSSNVLKAEDRHPEFESFYRDHIRKLLLATQATRYAAKANYHVARLAYLVRLFPDAKFLIAVRSPKRHIASLARQHEWFCRVQRQSPRALAFMQRTGHFEFGLDRRPVQLGDAERTAQIADDWSSGRETRGWARYWDMVYSYLDGLLGRDDRVRAASFVVRFETLCESPADTLRRVLDHCSLPDGEALVERFAASIRDPTYYTSCFSPEDERVIDEVTADTARRWGYG
jgi:hypothetical protein